MTTEFANAAAASAQPDFLLCEVEQLAYKIHKYSSFSTNYFPENILVDCPGDQSSRWSAHTNNPPQYLTLKLRRPAIVQKIKFGKFEKSHVCNLKKFRIYGGLEEENMTLLLEGGLKNDNIPEVFILRSVTENGTLNFPIVYIKIVPLLSWGPTFNFSIWYIELHGQDDPMVTNDSMQRYNKLREVEIIRLCLKHFRQQGYDAAFKALHDETQVELEDSVISELHKYLVVEGDFDKAEQFVKECVQKGLMDAYLQEQDYKHAWCLQKTESNEQPGYRGGHQLVMDTKRRLIYLYGGWDGYRDLSDLWVYDINKCTWTRLFEATEMVNGPTPRSCHKMVFDPVSENIFMLGRYLDNSIRTTEYIKSDFYLYDTRLKTWLQICDDTSQVSGPQLVYDHQMCIDAEKRTIYVFGGKILTPRSVTTTSASSEAEYSGLFSYHIATNTWTQILVDCHHPSASQADVLSIKSRVTHCMVFHTLYRKLYIYGGQRGKEDMDEFITYDVETQAVEVLNKTNPQGSTPETRAEPSPGYTLRATIDCDRGEIYVFSSLSKLKDKRDLQNVDASNSFWVYSLQRHQWSLIYTYRHNMDGSTTVAAVSDKQENVEPCPRYAHQLAYDDVKKVHYLFGGNPGRTAQPQLRLDDFWLLTLHKPKRENILKHCQYLVRKLHYQEMARWNPVKAMMYLRTYIAEVIDHSNKEQLNNFHKLATLLFTPDNFRVTPPLGKVTFPDTPPSVRSGGVGDMGSGDEESSHISDSEVTNPAEDLSIESMESHSTTTSGISDSASYTKYRKSGGKRPRHDYIHELRSRREFLFNKLVRLMPKTLVQPERNLSDFVTL